MRRNCSYNSILAPFIQELIDEKRSMGFIYDEGAYLLEVFDRYCIEKKLNTTNVTREFLDDWLKRRPTEGPDYQSSRITASRQLLLYMAGLGYEVYIPRDFYASNDTLTHVFTRPEIDSLFNKIDSYITPRRCMKRKAWQYKAFFRILFSTGMRCSELLKMPISEVDLVNGTLTVYHSKGHKDRIVYLADDTRILCIDYIRFITKTLGYEPFWMFPGRDPNDHMSLEATEAFFNNRWNETPYSKRVGKKPTVHSFRFTYVITRMNSWMEQGIDLDVMMPYLSKQLGHKGIRETFYYYIMTNDVNRIIKQKDRFGQKVIPKLEAFS